MRRIAPLLALTGVAAALLSPQGAAAHPERPSFFPDWRKGAVPTYRTTGPSRVVCQPESRGRIEALPDAAMRDENLALLERCGHQSIQSAVDAADNGDRILILPGVYREPESRAHPYPEDRCKDMFVGREGAEPGSAAFILSSGAGSDDPDDAADDPVAPSYEYQWNCPNSSNLIAIVGDDPDDPDRECDVRCNLQIEGTARQSDVLITADATKLNVIKADRADGVYLRNFTVERSDFNNIYVHETNGFVMDHIKSWYSREYGFLSFTSDNGLYQDLDAAYAGDSGVYPGAGPEGHCQRYGIEIRDVDSHDNNLGYSGTAGNGVWVHHSRFHDNAIGMVTDSFAPGHPGQPQDCAKWEDNEYYSNNADLFDAERDAYCKNTPPRDRDPAKVCPTFQVPVGTGILIAGGNGNIVRRNRFWDNWRGGVRLFYVPATFRGENDPTITFDTSNANQFTDNVFDERPDGTRDPNGTSFWWDEEGAGNCWSGNRGFHGAPVTSDPATLPACPVGSLFTPGNMAKVLSQASCSTWDPQDNTDPPGCDWFTRPEEPQ
jgi:hypothetical protein